MKVETQKVSDYVGRNVVSMSGGIKLGTVKDVLIDTDAMVATALLVSGDSGRGGLPFTNIIAIGADAITVENAESVFWASATTPGPGREAHEIKGLEVVNATGEVIGSVHDIELMSGKVTALDVHSGGVFGIGANEIVVDVHAVRSIGQKLVTVDVTVG